MLLGGMYYSQCYSTSFHNPSIHIRWNTNHQHNIIMWKQLDLTFYKLRHVKDWF